MKKKTFLFLFILKIFNNNIYYKIRSFLQLRYIYPKKNRFSSFLISILKEKNNKESKLRKVAADRVLVREYISSKTEEIILPDLLWLGELMTQEVYKRLPLIFYLKHRSSSGRTKLIDKSKLSVESLNKWMRRSSAINYSWITREWYYTNTKEFIAEKIIGTQELNDYKFFCCYGKPFLLQVDIDRSNTHKRNIYEIKNKGKEYKLLNLKLHNYELDNRFKICEIDNAYKLASLLSENFEFIRVDLYILNGNVYFGELTNVPGSGFEKFNPEIYDRYILELFNLAKSK